MKILTLAVFIVFILYFFIVEFGTTQIKPKNLPNYKVNIDTVDRYHVDSTGKYLLKYNGDTIK